MIGYLINSLDRTITRVPYDGDYKSIYALIGCDLFDVVRMKNGDAIYVDDEGLLKEDENLGWFTLKGASFALRGNGLVLGTDEDGDSVSPATDFDEFVKQVLFLSAEDLRQQFGILL